MIGCRGDGTILAVVGGESPWLRSSIDGVIGLVMDRPGSTTTAGIRTEGGGANATTSGMRFPRVDCSTATATCERCEERSLECSGRSSGSRACREEHVFLIRIAGCSGIPSELACLLEHECHIVVCGGVVAGVFVSVANSPTISLAQILSGVHGVVVSGIWTGDLNYFKNLIYSICCIFKVAIVVETGELALDPTAVIPDRID